MKPSRSVSLRRLLDSSRQAAELEDVSRLLTRQLPAVLGLSEASLLLWDRHLETFDGDRSAPDARYLISEGRLLETPGGHLPSTLVPLMARSGLVGMLVLGQPRHRRQAPFRPAEVRAISALADHAALTLENHLYQKELVATERMAALGTMAGMLAHDFRGPMTVIRGYAETLLEPGLSAEEVQERAGIIIKHVDRLEVMTTETLDFARGGATLVRRPVWLTVFLHDAAAALADELPGLEVLRDFALAPGIRAALDVDKLRRVLVNIGANARDAMGGAGRLHFHASVQNGAAEQATELVLELTDEGPGVAAEIRERLFQPFATFGKRKGTGLGLALARRFVEEHGGTLELAAPPPGGAPARGASFRIVLPLETAEAAAAKG